MSNEPDALEIAARMDYFPPDNITAVRARGMLRSQHEAIKALEAERDNLKTVMIAAAEEIAAHWDAHCDAYGYGPANLMHRLEQGIPAQYGYTAGAFAELKAERDALKTDAERYRWLRDNHEHVMSAMHIVNVTEGPDWDAEIDAARHAELPQS